jgi:hypothetical protein
VTSDDDLAALRAEVERLSDALVLANDAAFALAGIIGIAIVDAGIISRTEMAASIERRAGALNSPDHNPLLMAFARAVRMNFPGGKFEVIDGGLSPPVDSDPG